MTMFVISWKEERKCRYFLLVFLMLVILFFWNLILIVRKVDGVMTVSNYELVINITYAMTLVCLTKWSVGKKIVTMICLINAL